MRYAVIMAGGAGRRLWPLSRTERPKQLLPLIDGKSLLQLAVERMDGLFPPERILVVTSAAYADRIRAEIPVLPAENVVGEPQGRDTANAVALGAELLAARDPEATMAVFTADHVIRPADRFAAAVRQACDAAEAHADALLTFGIRPTWPHTGLGYVHCGEALTDGLHRVQDFQEKPDHATARRYVDRGNYYWNSGMFVWTLGAIRGALKRFLPDSARKLAAVGQAARAGEDIRRLLKVIYPTLQKISIDYAVLEKAPSVLMVELNCEWLDVGSWPALADVTEPDESGNVVIADNAVLVDSERNVVVTEEDHLLAVLGVEDCVVVHSPDATLVCKKEDALRLKELVADVEARYGGRFL